MCGCPFCSGIQLAHNPRPCISVVVCAAQVVAAVGANELALMAGEAMGAVGTDLTVVIDLRVVGFVGRAGCTVCEEIRRNFIIEDARPLGKHG